MKTDEIGRKMSALLKNKYLICALLVGAILLLLPGSSKDGAQRQNETKTELETPEFSLIEQETRLKELLSDVDGVGGVSVMLSLKSGVSRELAESGEEILVIGSGSGIQNTVSLSYFYPEYQGAVVICDGAGNAKVRLAVTEAVMAVTGLGSDKITVIKMRS